MDVIQKDKQSAQVLYNSLQQSPALVDTLKEELSKLNLQNTNKKQTKQKIRILQQRIKLIGQIKDYNEIRLTNLQKIQRHYSTNIYKPTQKYDFDKIKYINQHLTMDRFFAFVKDFNLNNIVVDGEVKHILQPKKIALLFKKCSSNSIYLDLPQFITLLERLFVQLFNANQNYKQHQQQLVQQRKKKRILAQLRQKIKQQKNRIKFNIQSPKKQVSAKAKSQSKKKMKKTQTKQPQVKKEEIQVEQFSINMQQGLYCFTDQEKIQSYMLKIGIDDKKQLQKKLRSFTKSDYKYYQVEDLNKFKPSIDLQKQQKKQLEPHPKRQLISIHHEWRKQKKLLEQSNVDSKTKLILGFMDVLDKMDQRQKVKSKVLLQRSLSKQQYSKIKKEKQIKFLQKQINLMQPYLKKETGPNNLVNNSQYSLQMLHQSSPNQLPISKIYPQRYLVQDAADPVYMKQFSLTHRLRKRKSSVQQSNAEMIKSTKRRVHELQQTQAENLSRLANNLLTNKDYAKKYLQKR